MVQLTLIVLTTIIFPLLSFLLLKTTGHVSHYEIPDIRQRRMPLMIYAILLLILLRSGAFYVPHTELYFFFMGSFLSTVVALSLNLFHYKISLHMIAMGGLLCFAILLSLSLITNMLVVIALIAIATGLTASSRLYLKAHTMDEIIFGFFVGVIPQVVVGYQYL